MREQLEELLQRWRGYVRLTMPEHPESSPMTAARAATVNSCVTQLEEVLTAAPSNVWSSEKPTEEGFYPWRREDRNAIVISVWSSFGDLWVCFPGTDHSEPIEGLDGEFGPRVIMPSEPVREP
jgi:hypothetical protein